MINLHNYSGYVIAAYFAAGTILTILSTFITVRFMIAKKEQILKEKSEKL